MTRAASRYGWPRFVLMPMDRIERMVIPVPGYLILSGAVVVIDQIVKALVRTHIPLHTFVPFVPGMELTYVQNTGAAFSMFSAHTWLLTVLSAVMSVVLLVLLARRTFPTRSGMLSVALLLGGAVGNLIDRFFMGFVTDMFSTTLFDFAVFNVADIGVTIGGIVLCLNVLVSCHKTEDLPDPDKRRAKKKTVSEEEDI